jgi:hypothetical protein
MPAFLLKRPATYEYHVVFHLIHNIFSGSRSAEDRKSPYFTVFRLNESANKSIPGGDRNLA